MDGEKGGHLHLRKGKDAEGTDGKETGPLRVPTTKIYCDEVHDQAHGVTTMLKMAVYLTVPLKQLNSPTQYERENVACAFWF
jgi:hypothetical protein